MPAGKARATGSHDVFEAGGGHRDAIHVPFDQDRVVELANRSGRFVKVVKHAPLGINRRFRRIHVFGHVLAESASAERHHFRSLVGDGEHHPPAKTVVRPPAFGVRDHQPASLQDLRLEPFAPEQTRERLAVRG